MDGENATQLFMDPHKEEPASHNSSQQEPHAEPTPPASEAPQPPAQKDPIPPSPSPLHTRPLSDEQIEAWNLNNCLQSGLTKCATATKLGVNRKTVDARIVRLGFRQVWVCDRFRFDDPNGPVPI